MSWDLKQPYVSVANADSKRESLNTFRLNVAPGIYKVSLHQQIGGQVTELIGPQSFEVDRIRENVLKNPLADMRQDYIDQLMALDMEIDLASHSFKKSSKHLKTLLKALPFVESSQEDLSSTLHALQDRMHVVNRLLEGSSSKAEVGEKDNLTLSYRLYFAANGLMGNSYGPIPLHMESFEVAKTLFAELKPMIDSFVSDVKTASAEMESAGAPVVLD